MRGPPTGEMLGESFVMIQHPHAHRLLLNYFINYYPTLGEKLGMFNKKSLVNLRLESSVHPPPTHTQIQRPGNTINYNTGNTIIHF